MIGISTNLSVDVHEIIDTLDPSRMDLSVSFRPHFVKINDMLVKLRLLKQNNWSIKLMCVGWLPLIFHLDEYHSYFKEFNFSVLPFWGTYNDKKYPADYTEGEKDIINRYVACREDENFKVDPQVVKGRIRRAGQVYAHIEPDGQVLRCSSGGESLSRNFFDDDFSLSDKPSSCPVDFCRCLEWLLVKPLSLSRFSPCHNLIQVV